MMTRQERAQSLHDEGYNCAQCVALACSDLSGADAKTLAAAAAGFGGGMRCGEVCGAVSGAVMTLGLVCRYDKAADKTAKDDFSKLTQRCVRMFREKYGKVVCRELLAQNKIRRCPEFIDSAVEIAEELSNEVKNKEINDK